MTAPEWKRKIKRYCKAAGTYRPFFESVIDTLAGILERRDEALEQYELSGRRAVISHTNKGGATNLEQNPALRAVNDMNRDALAYWRDLGLTPAGLKRINEEAVKPKEQQATLGTVLKDLDL